MRATIVGRAYVRRAGIYVETTRKLLVLDLDETLVYATETTLERDADFVVGQYMIYKRPGVDRFLEYALQSFDVGVWTSSGDEYASGVVDALFPSNSLQFVWSSDKCTVTRDLETDVYYTVKNLDKLKSKGYALESVIVIDDTPRKHARNFGNLVAVSEYTGQASDDELLLLMRYLEQLKTVPNVRAIEKRGWRSQVAPQERRIREDC